MKRIIIIGIILLLSLISACSSQPSSQPSLQLTDLNVSIVNDKSKLGWTVITEGDKKGQELVTTALYYEFTLKNVGDKNVGNFYLKDSILQLFSQEQIEKDRGIQIIIVPNSKLETISEEVVGFNIFNPTSYMNSGVGYRSAITPILKAGEERTFILYYDLGVSEKNTQVPLMVPSVEKLKKLYDNALDGSLVVMLEGTEISRFDLIKKQNQ